jgi:hypothetical protein
MMKEAIIWQKHKQKDGHKGYGSEWSLNIPLLFVSSGKSENVYCPCGF